MILQCIRKKIKSLVQVPGVLLTSSHIYEFQIRNNRHILADMTYRIDPRVQNMIATLNLGLKAVFDFHAKVSQKLDAGVKYNHWFTISCEPQTWVSKRKLYSML